MCLKQRMLHWCPRDTGQYRTLQRRGVLGKWGTILFIGPEVTALGLSHVCPPVLGNLLPCPIFIQCQGRLRWMTCLTQNQRTVSLSKRVYRKKFRLSLTWGKHLFQIIFFIKVNYSLAQKILTISLRKTLIKLLHYWISMFLWKLLRITLKL